MPNQNSGTRGGDHEQHVKAGQQSHKNTTGTQPEPADGGRGSEHSAGSTRGGTHEQHVKAGEQSHKNAGATSNTKSGR